MERTRKLMSLKQALKARGKLPNLYNKYSIVAEDDADQIRFIEKLNALFKDEDSLEKDINFVEYFDLKSTVQQRGIASMLGCGIADALGASTQFIPFVKDRHFLIQKGFHQIRDKIKSQLLNPRGRVGIWTDDCSMALCLADSILVKNFEFDPLDLRYRFMLWVDFGLNNGGRPYSIGLGGNIAISMKQFEKVQKPFTDQTDKFNNGNGSIMRLCPVPIAYRDNIEIAMDVAEKQSKTTHNGEQASECCRLLTKIIVDLINRKQQVSPKEQIIKSCESFTTSNKSVSHLSKSEPQPRELFQSLLSQFPKFRLFNKSPDQDRNWNWQDSDFTYSSFRASDMPGYVGSYCMDALSMALHIIYYTNSFYEAVLWAVNMGGDCDSVGSVVGQIAGAMYGIDFEMMRLYSEMVDVKMKKYQLWIKGYKLVAKKAVVEP